MKHEQKIVTSDGRRY